MSFRGQLYWDDQLGLVAIDENAQDPTNPDSSEIQPVPFDEITAGSVSTEGINNIYHPKTPTDIANAVDEVNQRGGGRIILPDTTDGERLDVSDLNLPLDITTDDVEILGRGRRISRFNTRGYPFFRADSTTYKHSRFANFSVTIGDASGGLSLDDWHGDIERVNITGDGTGKGLELTGCYGTRVIRCKLNNHARSLRAAIGSTGNSRLQLLYNEFSSASSADAVLIDDSGTDGYTNTPLIMGNLFISNEQGALGLEGVNNPWIIFNRFEGNGKSDNSGEEIRTFDDSQGDDVTDGWIVCNQFAASNGMSQGIDLRRTSRFSDLPPGMIIENNKFTDYDTAIVVRSSSSDVHIRTNRFDNAGGVADQGVRTVQSGWGQNSGDPSSTGDWDGNGYEGIQVRDTSNATNYAYVNGGWVTL